MLGGRLRAECGIANARRIVETGGRRKLLRTSIRSAERQRIIEAEANRIAMPTRQRRAMGSAIGKHCSSSSYPLAMEIFSGRVKGRDISFRKRDIPPFDFFREKIPLQEVMPRREPWKSLIKCTPAHRTNCFRSSGRSRPRKSEELLLRFCCAVMVVKMLSLSLQQMFRGASKRRRSFRREGYSA